MSSQETIFDGINLAQFIDQIYGFKPAEIKHFGGWSDDSFRVTTCDGTKFLLKMLRRRISSPFLQKMGLDIPELPRLEIVAAEVELIRYLSHQGFKVPQIVKTIDGDDFGTIGDTHIFRLQSYLEGKILDEAFKPNIARKVGLLAGRLSVALSKFQHPYYDKHPQPHFMVEHPLLPLREIVKGIKDDRGKDIVRVFFESYNEKVVAKIDQLHVQLCHTDYTGQNLLVNDDGDEIIGLIDFIDATKTYRILDAAAPIVSFLFKDPQWHIPCIEQFLEAFQEYIQLNRAEKEALPLIISARLILFKATCDIVGTKERTEDGHGLVDPGLDVVEQLLVTKKGELFSLFERFASS